ncbi:MAG: hypothetical protein ACYC5O_12305 [Anaerolineae bacterium]
MNHHLRRLFIAAIHVTALLSLLLPTPVAAAGPVEASVAAPPVRPVLPGDGVSATLSGQATVDWKVVYVVGYVDANTDYTAQANTDAAALRGMGMTVVVFNPGNNDWAAIVAAAADADVFIYAGHGMSWGGSPPVVGGMSLSATQKISPDELRARLRLAPNAIVILNHVCFASGGSTTDSGPITSAEAQRRVAQYADAFLDVGAVGYYSNWYNDFPVDILTYLAGGMTLGDAYEAYSEYDATKVERYAHPGHPDYAMWLTWANWPNGRMYTYSFVGDEHLSPLHPPAAPASVGIDRSSVQSRTEPAAGTYTYDFTVTIDGGVPVAWTAWLEGGASWVRVSPASGVSGGALHLTFTAPAQAGTYQTTLHVHTDDPRATQPDALVPITLTVAPPDPYEVRFPSVHG